MSHPLDGAQLRFERADKHLTEAESLIRVYGQTCTDFFVTDDQNRIVRLAEWPEIPPTLSVVASDVIHNLRAALDYVVFELARHDSGTIQHDTQFIIADCRGDFDARSRRRLKGLNAAHVTKVESLQPYNGVEWTRTLRDISNPDKHRELIVLSCYQRSLMAAIRLVEAGRFGPAPFRTPEGSHQVSRYDIDVDATNAIAIASEGPNGPSLFATLRHVETEVCRTIDSFKSELG